MIKYAIITKVVCDVCKKRCSGHWFESDDVETARDESTKVARGLDWSFETGKDMCPDCVRAAAARSTQPKQGLINDPMRDILKETNDK